MATKKDPSEKSIKAIMELLEQGEGWSLVNRSNVSALIIEAVTRGNEKLANKLREWL